MARPRQPIDLVVAKGKKHLGKAEVEERRNQELKVDLIDISIPKYLPKKLHVEFTDISNKLLHIGVMTELDEDSLARYLLAKETYLEHTKRLNKAFKSNDISLIEKCVNMQDKAFKQCRMAASDLGLTIASRCKLVLPTTPEEKPKNKFSKFA